MTGGSDRPQVVFVSALVGAGHNAAARALQAALAQRGPDVSTAFLDSMDLVPRSFRRGYAKGFEWAVVRMPRLYGLGFSLTNYPRRRRRGLAERVRLVVERRALRRLRATLLQMQPKLIVHTHFLASPMVGGLIGSGRLAARQMVVATDWQLHRFWYARHVDRWFVATDGAAKTLGRWGVADERVCLSGIPIHPKWRQPLERREVLARWQLPADRPIVLLSGGTTYTTGPIARIAGRLVRECGDACVCVLAGHSRKLVDQIAALGIDRARLRAIPMTDRVPELAHVGSVMVTKAGGIVTTECAAKSLPMVLLRPVPGQESANARFFEAQGAAIVVRRWSAVPPAVGALLTDQPRLQAVSAAAGGVDRPAAATITEAILSALGRSAPM